MNLRYYCTMVRNHPQRFGLTWLWRVGLGLAIGMTLLTLLFLYDDMDNVSSSNHNYQGIHLNLRRSVMMDEEENATSITKCILPSLDPWSPGIKQAYHHIKVNCSSDHGYGLDPKTSTLSRLSNSSWIDCCYGAFLPGLEAADRFADCIPIRRGAVVIPPEEEFLAIVCNHAKDPKRRNEMIQVLAQAPLKPDVEARLGTSKDEGDRVNVLIHVWDSVSEMEFQRGAPKLRKFLIQDLSAFWFEGFTKVGDKSVPNGYPLLTGKLTCGENVEYDGCPTPLIYQEYAKRGYRTSEAYDAPDLWIQPYKAPVDYYFRPVAQAAIEELGSRMRGSKKSKSNIPNLCWGPTLALQSLLDYSKALATTMGRDKRYLQMTWSTTHDLREDVLLDFLHWMQDEGHLNTTVFVFLSNHGGEKTLQTPQRVIEAKMPFLYFVFPSWFRAKYPLAMANLRLNRERLTTHFDMHATLLDLLDLSRIEDQDRVSSKKKGISLFHPIPETRSCSSAGIKHSECLCNIRTPISSDSMDAREGAGYAVSVINDFLSTFQGETKKCAKLTLHSVRHALLIKDPKSKSSDDGDDTYEVAFLTSPSNGSFQAVVTRKKTGSWSLSGAVIRTNGDDYANQSRCVRRSNNKDLKKYCFCLP